MKYIFAIILLFVLSSSFAQGIFKLRAESVAMKFQKEDGSWKEWTEWMDTNVLIVNNIFEKRITIYTNPKEVYDIASKEDETISLRQLKVY